MPESARASDVDHLLEKLRSESWSHRAEALREATGRLAEGGFAQNLEDRLAPAIIAAAKDDKWEVRKAAALALAEFRHFNDDAVRQALDTLSQDSNRFVSQAAARASRRLRSRADEAKGWPLTGDASDPLLQHIVAQIREIGLQSMTPAMLYDLAKESSESSYRVLAAETAHEIKTLLTPFEGYLTELRDHLDGRGHADPTATRYLDSTFSRLQQIQTMVDNLHAYSSSVKGESFTPVDLARVVRDAVAIGVDRASTSADVSSIAQKIQVPEGLTIDGLQGRLVRAFANLVANACQAMPEGGVLDVRATRLSTESVELTVSDTGHGMTSEEIEDAMERFRTTRRKEGGTGLGLPIAERIIQDDHGGDLSIESTPGRGTRVVVVLPVHHEAHEE